MPPTTSDRHEITAGLLESLGRLIRTSKALQQHHSPEFGLTGTPLGILRTLAAGDARPGDVATRLQLAPSVISRAVVPLEQAQLVERRTDPADARAWRLGLTEAGHRRLAQARQELVDNLTPLLGDWEGEDLATLTELLGRFERTLAGRLADADPRHPNLDSNEGRA
jgi:DNA-binding MarR family transcriptional regulator